jgi:Sulfotransferase family
MPCARTRNKSAFGTDTLPLPGQFESPQDELVLDGLARPISAAVALRYPTLKPGNQFTTMGSFHRSRFNPKHRRRPIVVSKIVARQKRAAVAVASPHDFTLEYAGELSAGRDEWPAPAYCLNHAEKQVLFAICHDNDRVFEAPFLWHAQYQQASQIATIPFERLNEFVCTVPERPIFVFSIGRCGSTLLSALLRASGAHTISEPDLLTQLARTGPEQGRERSKEVRRLLIRSCVASLTMRRTMPIAIKLRSQCNEIAREIAQVFPDGTYVVMMRDRHTWLSSRLRALGGDPRILASLYRGGLQTFHELQSLGMTSVMIWYEDLIDDPVGTVRLLMSNTPSAHNGFSDIRSVLNVDSQAGTVLEKNHVRRRGPTQEQIQRFNEEWEKIRPDSWIQTYRLDRLRTFS